MKSKNSLRFFSFFVVLLLSSCTALGPDFKTPDIKVPETWLDVDGKRIKVEQAEFKEWWKSFNDPVLEKLVQTAYGQNLTLRVAGIRIFEARATLAVAIGNWYPQVQSGFGSVNYNRMSEYGSGITESARKSGMDFAYGQDQVGVNATWEMDFWGKYRRSIESADAALSSTVAAYDQAIVSLLGDIASTYVQIRILEERLRIANENVKTQKESFQIADARFQAGATGARDVEQAKSQLYATEATIPELEQSLQQSKNALSLLLGIAPQELGDILDGKSGIPAVRTEIAVNIPADLLRRRPDVREAEYQAAAQSALIGATKAEMYPSFSLTGNFGFTAVDENGSHLNDMFKWGAHGGSIGPEFKWNILNYGQLSNAVRVQDALFEEALVSYQQAVLSAEREVEDGLVAFVKSIDRVDRLEKAVAAAKKTMELVLDEYQNGATDYTSVLTAEQSLLSQEDALVQAQGAVPSAAVSIYKALGGGWELRAGKDFIPAETKERMSERSDWGDLLNTRPSEEDKTAVPAVPDW